MINILWPDAAMLSHGNQVPEPPAEASQETTTPTMCGDFIKGFTDDFMST